MLRFTQLTGSPLSSCQFFPDFIKRPFEEVINYLISYLLKIILSLNKLINHQLETITHDLRLKFSTFFSANSTFSSGQASLTFMAGEYVTFPELLMDAHWNCAKNKLPVHTAIHKMVELMRSQEFVNPLPKA